MEMEHIASLLEEMTGCPVRHVPEGHFGLFRIKETATHYIDVLPQAFNWRVVRTPKDADYGYDRAWCFYGNDVLTLLRAASAAAVWGGADTTAPDGWDKNAITGQYANRHAV